MAKHDDPPATADSYDDELKLVTSRAGRAATVIVVGNLDAYQASELEDLGSALLADNVNSIVLDLAPTTFIDSSGLRVLLTVRSRMTHSGGKLALKNVSGAVRQLLVITGLLDEFTITGATYSPV